MASDSLDMTQTEIDELVTLSRDGAKQAAEIVENGGNERQLMRAQIAATLSVQLMSYATFEQIKLNARGGE